MIERPVWAGLFSGAIAAIVASLVQLPLYAPSDTLFNSATVTAGALVAGLASGVLWKVTRRRVNHVPLYGVGWGLLFLCVCSKLCSKEFSGGVWVLVHVSCLVDHLMNRRGLGTCPYSPIIEHWYELGAPTYLHPQKGVVLSLLVLQILSHQATVSGKNTSVRGAPCLGRGSHPRSFYYRP